MDAKKRKIKAQVVAVVAAQVLMKKKKKSLNKALSKIIWFNL